MALTTGTKLGPYEIVSAVGAGGMGEVYRARDTRLDRTVAIKILPAHLSGNDEAKQRFDREARAISSLSHPNICSLYDVGQQDGVSYLVMEYLEGETLADRLHKGPLPLEQALKIGAEICEGLDKAHRSGVVHRDLKPGNIMLTRSGAKLMDFGLAKPAAVGAKAVSSAPALPTMAQPLTAEGMMVGTFQYMSPEQVEGRDADTRSDVFALGAVLYEMITGQRAFQGRTMASTIAAILAADPKPISAIQPLSPPALEHIVKTCLTKDPEERWQTAHDVKVGLRWVAQGGSQSSVQAHAPRRRSIWRDAGWVVAVFVLVIGGALWWKGTGRVQRTMYFTSPLHFPANGLTLSPDGRTVALVAYSDQADRYLIWTYEVGDRSAKVVPGTEDASHPFWSPDGRSLGFFAGGKLKTVDAFSGRGAQVLWDAPHGRGGAWNRDGIILFSPDVWVGLYRIPSAGGTPVEITEPDASRSEMSHRWPVFLPDGKHFLYLAANFSGAFDKNMIFMGSLDSNEKRPLVAASSNVAYADPGYLLYLRDNVLIAQKFDPRTFTLSGEPRSLSDEVRYFPEIDIGLFGVAGGETLVLQTGKGAERSQLIWFDRNGRQTGIAGPSGLFVSPRLSPDGKHVAFAQPDGRQQDIWVRELESGAVMRLTFGPGLNESPVWSPDGKRLGFMSNRELHSTLQMKNADGSGTEQPITTPSPTLISLLDWSRDGKYVLMWKDGGLWYSLTQDPKAHLLFRGRGTVRNAQFSPDGKWVAYSSNETGNWEVYVTSFPDASSKWQVSTGGGAEPRFRRDGKELFYLAAEGKLMAVAVRTGSNFEVGPPAGLFQTHVRQPISAGELVSYDVSADGQRFLINTKVDEPSAAPLSIILNWASEVQK